MPETGSPIRLLPCGDRAIMVDCGDLARRRHLDALLREQPLDGVSEHVPAATTVLVRLSTPARLGEVAEALRSLDLDDEQAETDAEHQVRELTVRYDGPDLSEVADQLGISPEEVVARHTHQVWTVEFAGFMPGFGYLIGEEGGLQVSRRDDPRTRIPAGSVALADRWTGVYPSSSPGGWQIIGSCSQTLWDVHTDPPAVLFPGARIRFCEESR